MKFEDIKGMGKSRIEKLRSAGFNSPLDLLLHFPYKYVDLDASDCMEKLSNGDEFTVCGTVAAEPAVTFLRKGLRMTKVILKTTRYGDIEAVWFNQKYVKNALGVGKTVCVTGKVKKFRNKISVTAPVLIHPDGRRIVPMYRSIPGVPQNVVNDAIDLLLSRTEIRGYIPEKVRAEYGMPSLGKAFTAAHRPETMEEAGKAARALSLEKLGYTLGMFSLVKSLRRGDKKFAYPVGDAALENAVDKLPFALTDGQISALRDIVRSLRGDVPMNRLLQGDVGCGKTIVALLSMYFAFLNGYQSVLMAPTEILAVQHYKTAIELLERYGVKCALLCGSLSKRERDEVLFNIRNKTVDVVIGTHALIGDDVVFNKLALVITDEQQRFGVNQRGNLEDKAPSADTLVMTATPIPRTLALCMYGELEQSFIRALPSGRPGIDTAVVPAAKYGGMFDYLARRAEQGEQAYVVCPRIESDEDEGLASAVEVYEKLTAEYRAVNIGLLHGKMKDSEKSAVMDEFVCGNIRILVATTVIEVGIDVPNAANIIIFNPERYGLSQLHQLRGRVGRGDKHSYCFLPLDGDVPERIKFFCKCRDGYELSEYDFEQRGAGDFIGTRQHGDTDELPVKIDAGLIAEAKAVADATLKDADAYMKLKNSLTAGTEQYVRAITLN